MPLHPVRTVRLALCLLGLAGASGAAAQPAAGPVTIPGARVFPESIAAGADGTLYGGSIAQGGIWRVRPGSATAQAWLPAGAGGSMSTFGVLADARSGTLWVCSNNVSALNVPPPGGAQPPALKAFDLQTGKLKASYAMPGRTTLCNDVAVGPDGTLYATDSLQPHVLRLRPGAASFDVWAERPAFANDAHLDGVAVGADGQVYVDTFLGHQLFRIAVKPDGSAGAATLLHTSQTLDHPDALRSYGPGRLLLVEGAGRFDVVHLSGDTARIEVVKDGFNGPVSVVQTGGDVWVLEGQLNVLLAPKPGVVAKPFRAYPLPAPR